MRLHELEITAFGPFAETVQVDLDQLSDAGLFLLCGDTGAGKTSILDAICFALYGDVPGDRSAARRLRCDTATPERAPRVRLVATLAGRRFQITRTPAWQRPKKRGTGLTPEQASVLVQEEIDGAWSTLSSRMDEAGHLLSGLVGMTITQFCQVVMLPQGRFQAFLRATSDERHRLLQHLFSTGRFDDIERWIRDHARELRRSAEARAQTAQAVLHRIDEATGGSAPDDILDGSAATDPDRKVADWLASLAASADAERSTASEALERCGIAARAASEARDIGRGQSAAVVRRDQARQAQRELAAHAGDHAAREAALAAARRAIPVHPRHEAAEADRAAHQAAEVDSDAAWAALRRLLDAEDLTSDDDHDDDPLSRPSAAWLSGLDERLRHQLAETRALLPLQTDLDELLATAGTLDARWTVASEDRSAVATRLETRPEVVAALSREHAGAEAAAGRVESARAHLTEIHHLISVHAALEDARERLTQARAAARDHHGEVLTLKESLLDLRERRIIGMAAELAGKLAVGQCCPVCGSDDHPHKARAAADAPDARVERGLAEQLATAEGVQAAHDDTVRGLETQTARLEGEAGSRTLEQLREAVAEAQQQLDADLHTAERLDHHAADLAKLRAADEADQAQLAALDLELARLETRVQSTRHEADSRSRSIEDHLAATGHSTLNELLVAREELLAAIRTSRTATETLESTGTRADQSQRALEAALTEHGFADVGQSSLSAYLTARREPREIAALEQLVADHQQRQRDAAATLADPEILDLGDRPAPDLDRLDLELTEATEALHAAVTRHDLAERLQARLGALSDELRLALAEWAPLRHQHEIAAELAAFVEGKSSDNQFRMRLSAYVLAWRLTQVVEAANDRLGPMTGHRFSLEHTGQRGAGETRGGLSLLVRDVWSGEQRDPTTLSGGETFIVSLALALGLSDVVAHEAGGHQLDTLFVDEGFGSLDPDTLDDVMGILDELREGGRVVGVVSHVAELRTRIPTQLVVSKARAGSTVRVELGA